MFYLTVMYDEVILTFLISMEYFNAVGTFELFKISFSFSQRLIVINPECVRFISVKKIFF